jgi:hypothetical protein
MNTLKTRTEMVLETLVFSPLNQLARLIAWEYVIIQCRCESYKSYIKNIHDYPSPYLEVISSILSVPHAVVTRDTLNMDCFHTEDLILIERLFYAGCVYLLC